MYSINLMNKWISFIFVKKNITNSKKIFHYIKVYYNNLQQYLWVIDTILIPCIFSHFNTIFPLTHTFFNFFERTTSHTCTHRSFPSAWMHFSVDNKGIWTLITISNTSAPYRMLQCKLWQSLATNFLLPGNNPHASGSYRPFVKRTIKMWRKSRGRWKELDHNMLVGNSKDVTYECWWKLARKILEKTQLRILQQLFKLRCNVKWDYS